MTNLEDLMEMAKNKELLREHFVKFFNSDRVPCAVCPMVELCDRLNEKEYHSCEEVARQWLDSEVEGGEFHFILWRVYQEKE